MDQVRMSGATAQKVRIAGLESVFVGGDDGTGGGVRVGQEVAPILAPQAEAPQQANNNIELSTSTPLQDPFAKLRELCRKERERGVSLILEKRVENPNLMSRSLAADPVGGSPKSMMNWAKPHVSYIAKRKPLHDNVIQGLGRSTIQQ